MPSEQPPRLVDVAARAGVHVSTASRVLNGREEANVRDETRDRILSAAAELRYRPNALARGLKTSSTTTIGLLLRTLESPVMAEMARAASARAWERGYVVVMAEDDGVITERAWERIVDEGRIDGLLVASAATGGPILDLLDGSRLPYVFVDHVHPGSGRNISLREADAGRIAAEHLIGLGHRRLAQLSGPPRFDSARRRSQAFHSAVLAAGLPEPLEVTSDFSADDAQREARALLADQPRPTGVFASSLSHAIGFLSAARETGLAIPQDVSVIAYDDHPLLDFLSPGVTSIRMPMGELGRVATDALIAQIDGDAPLDVEIATQPAIVPRSSTAPPPEE
jgi:LacI family transcriptional regulator